MHGGKGAGGRKVGMGNDLEERASTGPGAAPGSVKRQGRCGVGSGGAIRMGMRRCESQKQNKDFTKCLKVVIREPACLKNQDTAWPYSHLRENTVAAV